ncbi:intraflagellar transporter-like protein (macronuclear) [Tetrahymena thermophila SB210]|uniref:Intraflagellar transporter-like protein n=1 Tax=Tetrahymena thermophila (strain SB210) TaxID=312017 RepID=I7M1P1_TETTS|nr:intraflagellar transporter-like protein [Tetrahymena thermophila SB210]EAR97273.1 intraflagellar transporter-like protein [Tetrahymena thermophila SB210]|eukprot:XP_001017518.1 intraflagellar transporter-like protein [Tetrahymena thermophila SB210]
MADKISITFDEENKIRVLEQDKYKETDQLKNESMEFIKKVLNLDEVIAQIIETLENYAKKIEQQKLRAIGERNKVESEAENRKKKMMDLNNLLNEKKAELERYSTELESIQKVESEQKYLIDKLSNNEA